MSVDANRRTGRTTRMVEAAVSRFLDGNSVLNYMPALESLSVIEEISQEKEVPLIGGPGERALSMASLCDGQYKE